MTKLSRRQTLAALLTAGAGIANPSARATALSVARLSFLHVNDVYRIDEDQDRRGGGGKSRARKGAHPKSLSYLRSCRRHAVAEPDIEFRPRCAYDRPL